MGLHVGHDNVFWQEARSAQNALSAALKDTLRGKRLNASNAARRPDWWLL
jgi:hypothetical protein